MASMHDRQKLVNDKKQELLRRIAEKRKNEQSKQPPLPSPSEGTAQTVPKSPAMFVNDGNFLARFQAMQQQKAQTASASSTTTSAAGSGSDSRPTITMKLTTVKKSTPAKPVPARPDVFEEPDDVEENGKFEYLKLQVSIVAKHVWCNFDLAKCLKMF